MDSDFVQDRKYYLKSEDTNPEKNEEIINQIAKADGDDKVALAWKLTELNYPLVIHMVSKHFNSFKDKDFIISDGVLALHDACKNINENTPNKMFTTYACSYIYGYIIRGLKQRERMVKSTKFDGVETKADECSIESFGTDIEDPAITTIEEQTIKQSDGDFCKEFIQDIKDYYMEQKEGHYSTFFNGSTQKILDALMTCDTEVEMVKKCGVTKQRIDQVKQSLYLYTIQTLRDSNKHDKKEIFDIIYSGKYSVNNPPPLKGWRKKFWDMVFSTKEYKSHTKYKELAK